MDPTKKERIISQTQTKLPIFRWYREKNYFTNIKKHINPWMRQRKKNYSEKRTEEYESMDKEAKRDLFNKRKEENQRQSHISRIMY